MAAASTLQSAAQQALEFMRGAGFEHAQVTAGRAALDELNANENVPTLLRTTESYKLSLQGIVDARSASTEVVGFDAGAVKAAVADLFADARSAPQDDANAVSSGQRTRIVQGPQQGDRDQLAGSVADLLAFREREAPKMMIRQAEAQHHLYEWQTLTTGGSDLAGSLGWYSLVVGGTARDGTKSSSMNFSYGNTDALGATPAPQLFGIGQMMRDAQRQIETRPFGEKFTGDVVLTPNAVESLLSWFLGQLGDMQLISGSSLYREKVGQQIASPLVSVCSRFDAPGVAAVSGDGFAAPAVTLLEGGVLRTLTPSLYGSRKTGLRHVPVAGGGWDILPGETPLADMVGGVKRGALVSRLSMGAPAANGNFSGVIKNSFAIEGGEVGHALAEVMITGNMAQMLQDVVAVSRETQDGDGTRLPWLRIAHLHFS